MTTKMTMYARRKNMDLQDIDVRIGHAHREDVYVMNRRMHYIGKLGAEERERLTESADKRPVHKTLTGQIGIVTEAD